MKRCSTLGFIQLEENNTGNLALFHCRNTIQEIWLYCIVGIQFRKSGFTPLWEHNTRNLALYHCGNTMQEIWFYSTAGTQYRKSGYIPSRNIMQLTWLHSIIRTHTVSVAKIYSTNPCYFHFLHQRNVLMQVQN